ncbi:MAG: hypothetical protein NUV84_02710, partial [Candidatus Uhrbacteria bacterium]|nr:hypothetical protein [Candidatus Uhrbacteria bacterium]
MTEQRQPFQEQPSTHDREPRPRFDLSTIMGIKVDEVEIPEEVTQKADEYLKQLAKEGANQAQLAELAYAFRRQLRTDLRAVKEREKLLKTDDSHAFSLAVYRKLLEQTSQTLQTQLARHEKERKEINGSYEEYKGLESRIEEKRGKLIELLTEMFKVVGQDVKPVHLAKRALLEAQLEDLESKLASVKNKNPDVAA